jgi:hypothetical protein
VRRAQPALWIGLIASLSCQPRTGGQPERAMVPESEQIRAAFLLYANEAAWGGRSAVPHFTCIEVEGGADPSAALLELLSGRKLGLRKRSACAFRGRNVVEPVSGSPAVILQIAELVTMTPGLVRVRGGYTFGRLDGAQFVCELERHGSELSRVLS